MNNSKFSGWQKVLLIIVPYLVMISVFQVVSSIFLGDQFSVIEESGSKLQKLGLHFFDGIASFTVVWLFMKYIDKEKFINVGFQVKGRFKDFLWGLASGFLIMGMGFLTLWRVGEIQFLGFNFNVGDMLILVATFSIVSVVEEVLFRGYILRNLMQSFNKYAALLFSSAFFALLHSSSPNANVFSITSIFLAGTMLGLSYVYTQNLWFPIGLHLGWNLFQSYFGFNVSGKSHYSLFETGIETPSFFNGGSFGFEATVLAIAAETLMIWLIWRYFSKSKKYSIDR